ncbi:hypothetical protein M2436_005725 [Streptomyces sp. HB372]|nr:hypothetical protein [Streptomyces sp. HB372]
MTRVLSEEPAGASVLPADGTETGLRDPPDPELTRRESPV